jgi:phage gp45-like
MTDSIGERLFRRILSATGLARITASRDDTATQVLQLDFGGGEIHDNRYRLAEYGFSSRPLPGADAFVAFPMGDRSGGVVIATGDRRYRLQSLAAGEVALYDDLGHIVKLSRSGISIDGGGHNLTIANTPKVTIAGDLEATGDVKAGTVSLKQHKHTGVSTGAALTGVPAP